MFCYVVPIPLQLTYLNITWPTWKNKQICDSNTTSVYKLIVLIFFNTSNT